MNENPGAYHESRNRLREQKEKERERIDAMAERFEKEREILRTEKKFDIFQLRQRIETLHSLNILRSEIRNALKEGVISREMFDSLEQKINSVEKNKALGKEQDTNSLPRSDDIFFKNLPFSDTELAKFFEKQKIGDNIFVDIGGFFYGFIIQGGAILVILFWKILLDIIFLPRDIYNEIKK